MTIGQFRQPYGRQIFERIKMLDWRNGVPLEDRGPFPIEGGALATDARIMAAVQCGPTEYIASKGLVQVAMKTLERYPISPEPLRMGIQDLRSKVLSAVQYELCPCLTRQIPDECDPHADPGWLDNLYGSMCTYGIANRLRYPYERPVEVAGTTITGNYLAVCLEMMDTPDDGLILISPTVDKSAGPVRIDYPGWTVLIMGRRDSSSFRII